MINLFNTSKPVETLDYRTFIRSEYVYKRLHDSKVKIELFKEINLRGDEIYTMLFEKDGLLYAKNYTYDDHDYYHTGAIQRLFDERKNNFLASNFYIFAKEAMMSFNIAYQNIYQENKYLIEPVAYIKYDNIKNYQLEINMDNEMVKETDFYQLVKKYDLPDMVFTPSYAEPYENTGPGIAIYAINGIRLKVGDKRITITEHIVHDPIFNYPMNDILRLLDSTVEPSLRAHYHDLIIRKDLRENLEKNLVKKYFKKKVKI